MQFIKTKNSMSGKLGSQLQAIIYKDILDFLEKDSSPKGIQRLIEFLKKAEHICSERLKQYK